MCKENETQIAQIRLLGFQGIPKYKPLLFIVFLLTCLFILVGNLLIILLVTTIDHLKTPMFYFVKNLSIADILQTTSVLPKVLDIIYVHEIFVSFWGCMIQMYLFCIFGFVQCYIIAVMSYDRYLAICHPLRYASLMRPNVCLWLVIGSWLLVGSFTSSEIIVVFQFDYCGLDSIDHFFCDFGPVVELATSDTSSLVLSDFINGVFVIYVPFAFIILTYLSIFYTILKISSSSGKRKAFSTCSSHLITVGVYYGTLMTVYMTEVDVSKAYINKYRSMLYLVVTPMMNPIIYSLRNKELKRAMQKLISQVHHNLWQKDLLPKATKP